jgi:hypothetical protein
MNNVKNLKNEKLAVRCRKAKKFTVVALMAIMTIVMASMFAMCAFAEGEGGGGGASVSTSSFISTACKVLKALIILIGAGIGVWGLVNLVEGYGSDNPGSKSQGMKQLMAGIALIILAVALVPELENMMSSASV